MNIIRLTLAFVLAGATASVAAGPLISDLNGGNRHNLSSLNTGAGITYKAAVNTADSRSEQICVFCHTPHNGGQIALWNRTDPTRTFGHYSSATLRIKDPDLMPISDYGEPTGASRLCLSCHDGVTALGAVISGGGMEIDFGVNSVVTGEGAFTDVKVKTGHHPVSFVYNNAVVTALGSKIGSFGGPYKLPSISQVKLDKWGRMQCTTCHNPHQNQSAETTYPDGRKIAPFWVYHGAGNTASQDQQAVCTTCHPFSSEPWEPNAP